MKINSCLLIIAKNVMKDFVNFVSKFIKDSKSQERIIYNK